jgi:starch-binding outer membrane protein, SusD/RagB family
MKNKILLGTLFLGLLNTSCQDYLEEVPVSQASYSYYDTEKGMDDLISSAYSELRWKLNGEQSFTLYEYGVDEVRQAADGLNKHYDGYGALLNPSDQGGFLHAMWTAYYRAINACNLGIERVPNVTGGTGVLSTAAGKKIREAELKFLRAYYYFELVQQFGAIPLSTKGTIGVQLEFSRTPVAQVYEQIISDLVFASDNLPVSQSQFGRATKGAANHFLAKVYLTRGSAVKDQRGQKADDMDNAIKYSEAVINSNTYRLESDFANLFPDPKDHIFNNEKSSEFIFNVQFNNNLSLINNAFGNRVHLYWGMVYDNRPGMLRDLLNGRPFRRIRPTDYTMNVFDRANDSRFYKSFKWVYYSNNAANITRWTAANAPNPSLVGRNKWNVGDTCIFITPEKSVAASVIDKAPYNYYPMNTWDLQTFPPVSKYFDPTRDNFQSEFGVRDFVLARLAETYLIAAEAYGRKGNYTKAAELVNIVRRRAGYKSTDKYPYNQRAKFDGVRDLKASTENQMNITPDYWTRDVALEQYPASANTTANRFIHFILNERTREFYGELIRWNDLVRTETLVERVKKFNEFGSATVQDYHMKRPIPLAHIERIWKDGAPLAKEQYGAEQNPGY